MNQHCSNDKKQASPHSVPNFVRANIGIKHWFQHLHALRPEQAWNNAELQEFHEQVWWSSPSWVSVVVLASPNEGKGSCDRVSPFCVCNLQDRIVSGSPLGLPT